MSTLVRRVKYLGKRSLFGLPATLGRPTVSAACAAGLLRLSYLVYHKLGRPNRVLSGPFQGMSYIPIAAGSAWMPKLLGTYESELRPALIEFAAGPCDVLIDVGTAEGYYAVGLAKIMNIPKVIGFDTDPIARDMVPKLARLNGVAGRVEVRGFCHLCALNSILRDAVHRLAIVDCEGGEVDLMDPVKAPELKRARVIVEIHDFFGSERIGSILRERFATTHHIEAVPVADRRVDEFPSVAVGVRKAALSDAEKAASLHEGRPPAAGWLVLRPKVDPWAGGV